MKVWLVNPFDPLPGEREQFGRYAHLAQALTAAGHGVLWWSSSFSHRFKREVDPNLVAAGAKAMGIEVRLVPTPAYTKNVSRARLESHKAYAGGLQRLMEDEPSPDVVLASSPPLESACVAARFGQKRGTPVIIDIQDQWPDNFVRVMPKALRPLKGLLLARLYRAEAEAYRLADGIVGVAQGYVDRGIRVGGAKRFGGVFPLGASLAEVDAAMERGSALYGDQWLKPADQIWMLYSGSLSHNYDFLTIVRAAIYARRRFGDKVRFVLTGQGELADRARRIISKHELNNVTMTGFLDPDQWACVLSKADVGFNAAFPDALIYFPNKIFYYFAAGAAVLNTIPGQCADVIDREGCGLNYTAGDPQSCFDVIARLVESPAELAAMGKSARRLATEVYDRRIVYGEMTRFLEQVAREKRTAD